MLLFVVAWSWIWLLWAGERQSAAKWPYFPQLKHAFCVFMAFPWEFPSLRRGVNVLVRSTSMGTGRLFQRGGAVVELNGCRCGGRKGRGGPPREKNGRCG